MPTCPKCASKLSKNKSAGTYSCRRHGFVRNVMKYDPSKNVVDKDFISTYRITSDMLTEKKIKAKNIIRNIT